MHDKFNWVIMVRVYNLPGFIWLFEQLFRELVQCAVIVMTLARHQNQQFVAQNERTPFGCTLPTFTTAEVGKAPFVPGLSQCNARCLQSHAIRRVTN